MYQLLRQIVKRYTAFFAVFIILLNIGLLTPSTSHAQLPVTDVAALQQQYQEYIERNVGNKIRNAATQALATSLINIMSYFANNLAYDAALLVATGGNADEPLFDPRPFEDYLIYAGANVASQVVGRLVYDNVENGELKGFNVCAPPNLSALRLGIQGNYKREDLEICGDLNAFKDNWGGFFANVRNSIADPQARNETILNTLAQTLEPNTSEFSVSLGLYTDTLLASQQGGQYELLKHLSDNGYKDVVDFITGQTKTPADSVQSYADYAWQNQVDTPFDLGGYLLSNTDALLTVATNAGSIFTNTLLSKTLERISNGLYGNPNLDQDPFDEFASGGSSRDSAAVALRDIQTFQPLDASNFNFLAELSSCPSNLRGTSRRLYNCVIDTNFATALSRAEAGNLLTLQEAIEEGLINRNWPLIPAGDEARDQDPNCYTYGFCHSNLVKLRKARIIPVGWELATQLDEARTGTLTLGEVMDGFNDCNGDNERGEGFEFCHLIDPNWVLKMPETSCRILANGQILQAAGVATRSDECVDVQSCIQEDDSGQCVGGYGYCVREENTWRFRGDQCDATAASCLGFQSRDGEEVHFLTTTVDQSGCNEGNAGCTWYQTAKQEQPDGSFDWPVLNDTEAAENRDTAYEERIYMTGAVQGCRDGDAGCTELIPRGDLTLNILTNPGFETDSNNDSFPDAWFSNDYTTVEVDSQGLSSRSGVRAVNPHSASFLQTGIELNTGSFYTLSYYIKSASGSQTANSAVVSLALETADGDDVNLAFISFDTSSCTRRDSNGNGTLDAIEVTGSPDGVEYERISCSFTVPAVAGEKTVFASMLVSGGNGALGAGIWVDDLQLENAAAPSDWTSGYSQNISTIDRTYLKIAPDYLNCTGSASDPEECANYAKTCSENDIGCTEYNPVNGDPAVTGIVSERDQCDESCSGYDTYKQEPTRYEPSGDFPVYFIPSTADQCSADAVGCDEFTNLQTEEKEYFTYLRACVTEDQAAGENAVFYTWEGSDVEGYQLRTWSLLESDVAFAGSYTYPSGFTESNLNNAPCTQWIADEDGIQCAETVPDIVNAPDVSACDEHDDIFDNPDCREFYDADGNIHYRDWRDTVTVNNACVSYRKTTFPSEAVCAESGGYFNPATSQCIYYGFSEESERCSESENGCREYTGGQSRNSRLVLNDNFEGDLTNWDTANAALITLSNESIATDGHSMKSENGATVRTHLFDNGGACSTPGGCLSTPGALGASCVVVEGERFCGTLEEELFQGKTYTLTFWAKGNGALDVGFDFRTAGAATIDAYFANNVALEPDWKRYSFGPLNMRAEDFANFGSRTTLTFDPDGATEVFIDNIILREGESNITVIRDSWVTPAICDENFEGQTSPQFQLGCQEYTDQTGNNHFLKSFSRLCGEDVVGCDAFYKTANSESVNAQVFNATCRSLNGLPVGAKTSCYLRQSGGAYNTSSPRVCDIAPGNSSCQFDLNFFIQPSLVGNGAFSHIAYEADTQVVPHDRTIYAIFDSAFTCFEANAGCQEVGLPQLSADHSVVESYETTYLVNDPDEYNETLCQQNELFCEEWTSTNDGVWYFRDPVGKTCEYKTNVTAGGATYDGWFRTGTSDLCYGTGTCSGNSAISCSLDSDCATAGVGTCNITSGSYVIAGVESGLWRNGDADYDGWVGTCGPENDGCSEFLDPLQIEEDEFYAFSSGESYYFIDNNNLDENTIFASERCNGQVSQSEGCILFDDTGNTAQRFNASASRMLSEHADRLLGGQSFDLVDPIDCDAGNSVIRTPSGRLIDLCAQRCVYRRRDLQSTFNRANASSALDLYRLGESCVTADDCVPYESDRGDVVDGFCRTTVTDPTGAFAAEDVPRLQNDTNRVLKVNRDRQCSEWLACSSERTIWDASIGAYRSICEGIDLCVSQGEDGSSSYCTEWDVNDPAAVLDINRYAARDVSWYGEEYSGYAIPDLFPVQELTQENIAPQNVCVNQSTGDVSDRACETDADCPGAAETCEANPNDDYRLAFDAGSCNEGYGESCQVGYCSLNGLPCSEQAQCGSNGGQCVIGECLAVTDANAASPDDCADDEIYNAGVCYSQEGFCGFNGACGAGSTCVTSTAYKEGACYRDRCLLTVQGSTFDTAQTETQVCRAYPEENSPFASEIATEWISPTSQPTSDPDLLGYAPLSTISGYDAVNLCAPGEDCLCSYKKLSGEAGSNVYLGVDSEVILGTSSYGICSGGVADGALCRLNVADSCGTGECKPISKIDTVYGLPGYCLERDTGININGDPDLGACVTWLPVDQLQGQTDLYAKYLSAGYTSNTETAYCSTVWPYADVKASKASDPGIQDWQDAGVGSVIACTEKDHSSGDNPLNECFINNDYITCPPGQFMFGSAYYNSGNGNGSKATFARSCDGNVAEARECPFMCIPEDAILADGRSCLDIVVDAVGNDVGTIFPQYEWERSTPWQPGFTEDQQRRPDLYYMEDTVEYTRLALELADCWSRGIEMTDDQYFDSGVGKMTLEEEQQAFPTSEGTDAQGWTGYEQDVNFYMGCQLSTVVDRSTNESAPYTDRLLNPSNNYALQGVKSGYEEFAYTDETQDYPFGRTLPSTQSKCEYTDCSPAQVASCTVGSAETTITITPPSTLAGTCEETGSSPTPGYDPSDPEARSFVDFTFSWFRNLVNGSPPGSVSNVMTVRSVTSNGSAFLGQKELLAQLFAKSVDFFQFNDGVTDDSHKGQIQEVDLEPGTPEFALYGWDERESLGRAPTVRAVNTEECFGSYCEEGTDDQLTINSQNAGDLSAEGGYFRIALSFFGFAYKDQLPLRQVVVDWGEGDLPSSTADNYYKNHRGLELGTQSKQICDRCEDDPQRCEWGMTPDSCDANFFSYSHNYTCTETQATSSLPACTFDGDGSVTNSPCRTADNRCAFQVRVHLRDNWGWCSGTCDGEEGCYDGDGRIEISNQNQDQCNYESLPSGSGTWDPWVYYDGVIYVAP